MTVAVANWDPPMSVRRIVVHHSASPRKTTDAEDIRRWHIEDRGWEDIGYHLVIQRGRVVLGRPLWRVGAHDGGENHETLGVLLVGDYTKETPGSWAWPQLVQTCADLLDWFDLDTDEGLRGHGEDEPSDTPTLCPGFNVGALRLAVRTERQRRRRVASGLYPYTERT